jgi:Tol biopolymer transport system component
MGSFAALPLASFGRSGPTTRCSRPRSFTRRTSGCLLDRPGSHLYLVDTERSTIHPITFGMSNEESPSVAPSGNRIAFTTGAVDYDLIRIALDGSRVDTLLSSARSERRPTWSPTGGQVAYVSDARGTAEIWIRSLLEGWSQAIVKRDPEGRATWQNLHRPSFSPDGRRIVYEVVGARHAIWVAAVADGRGVPLDAESPDQHSPAWSPDGNWIAYQRLVGQDWELVKMSLSGGAPVRLARTVPGGGDHTAWSPDGRWIAHEFDDALRLTAADGGSQKTVNGPMPTVFGFSKNGSSIYAVRLSATRRWELVNVDLEHGREQTVAELNLPSRGHCPGSAFTRMERASRPRSAWLVTISGCSKGSNHRLDASAVACPGIECELGA